MGGKPLTELTDEEIVRVEWGHVHGVLVEARKRLEAEGFGVQSWMIPAIDIAESRATRPVLSPRPGWTLVPPDGGPWSPYARRDRLGRWEVRWLSTSSNDPGPEIFGPAYAIPWPFTPADMARATERDFLALASNWWVEIDPLIPDVPLEQHDRPGAPSLYAICRTCGSPPGRPCERPFRDPRVDPQVNDKLFGRRGMCYRVVRRECDTVEYETSVGDGVCGMDVWQSLVADTLHPEEVQDVV